MMIFGQNPFDTEYEAFCFKNQKNLYCLFLKQLINMV